MQKRFSPGSALLWMPLSKKSSNVTDMEKAFAAAGPVRKEAYGPLRPAVTSTILETPRLALAAQLIEVSSSRR